MIEITLAQAREAESLPGFIDPAGGLNLDDLSQKDHLLALLGTDSVMIYPHDDERPCLLMHPTDRVVVQARTVGDACVFIALSYRRWQGGSA